MKVLLTGASSFSGFWIARYLSEQEDVEPVVVLRQRAPKDTLEKKRVDHLRAMKKIKILAYEGMETESMQVLLKREKPEVFIGHGTYMENYRQPDYDIVKVLEVSVFPMKRIVATFRDQGGCLFVHTGSVFEPREGSGDSPEKGMSAYGVSKAMVYDWLRHVCQELQVHLLKVVIPNPIGPFENSDRLIPVFIDLWKRNKKAQLRDAELVRDNIPASWLAESYVRKMLECFEWAQNEEKPRETIFRPSGICGTQKEFVQEMSKNLSARLHKPCAFEVSEKSQQSSQPAERVNSDSVATYLKLERKKALDQFWDELVDYYHHGQQT